ncbi:hypothetical protein LCGC14_2630880, partial [marine sediment metagenome]
MGHLQGELLDVITKKLHKYKASAVEQDESLIRFYASYFRAVLNTNPLCGIVRCDIWVADEGSRLRMDYRVDFTQHYLIALAMTIFMGLGMLFLHRWPVSSLAILPVFWIF